jgi:hypothetical protein
LSLQIANSLGASRVSHIIPIEASSQAYLIAAGATIHLVSISQETSFRIHAFESHQHLVSSLDFNRKTGNQFLSTDISGRTKLWCFLQNQNEKFGLAQLLKRESE